MAKGKRTGPKQRKARDPKNKPMREEKPKSVNDEIEAELAKEAEHTAATMESARLAQTEEDDTPEKSVGSAQAVTINERQIASDTLSLSGDKFSDFIARLSDVIQANGKIILTIIVLALTGAIAFYLVELNKESSKGEYDAMIARAGDVDANLEGREAADKLQEQFKAITIPEDPAQKATYWLHFSKNYYTAIMRTRRAERDTMTADIVKEDNETVIGYFEKYREIVEANPEADPASKNNLAFLAGLERDLTSDQEFKQSVESRFTKLTEYWETEEGEKEVSTSLIDKEEYSREKGNPIVTFMTNRGKIRIRLFELEADSSAEGIAGDRKALENSIAMVIQLIERGYYDRQTMDGVNAPGTGSSDNPTKYQSHWVEWGKRGRLPRKPKDGETEEEAAKAGKMEDRNPDFTILPERNSSVSATNDRGVYLIWEESQPLLRGTRLAINLGCKNDLMRSQFQLIGEVVDDESFAVAKDLRRSDSIWKAWVEQKREDTMSQTGYLPYVMMLNDRKQTSGKNQIPVLWTDEEPDFVAPTVEKTDSPAMIAKKGDSFAVTGEYKTNNPVVVLSTDKGDIVIELYEDQSPNSVKNFVYLIQTKLDFLKESGFSMDKAKNLLTGGEPAGEGIGYTIESEADSKGYALSNVRGTIAMGYSGAPNSANTEFVFNLDDKEDRDGNPEATGEAQRLGYTVFGRVIKNFWALSEFDSDTKVTDAWVVQLRDGVAYDPKVTFTGDIDQKKASEGGTSN